jgi:hypothetical protein
MRSLRENGLDNGILDESFQCPANFVVFLIYIGNITFPVTNITKNIEINNINKTYLRYSAVVGRDISSHASCCGIRDVVVLVLGQVIEIKSILVDRCLETQGQLVLRGVLNLQTNFPL